MWENTLKSELFFFFYESPIISLPSLRGRFSLTHWSYTVGVCLETLTDVNMLLQLYRLSIKYWMNRTEEYICPWIKIKIWTFFEMLFLLFVTLSELLGAAKRVNVNIQDADGWGITDVSHHLLFQLFTLSLHLFLYHSIFIPSFIITYFFLHGPENTHNTINTTESWDLFLFSQILR